MGKIDGWKEFETNLTNNPSSSYPEASKKYFKKGFGSIKKNSLPETTVTASKKVAKKSTINTTKKPSETLSSYMSRVYKGGSKFKGRSQVDDVSKALANLGINEKSYKGTASQNIALLKELKKMNDPSKISVKVDDKAIVESPDMEAADTVTKKEKVKDMTAKEFSEGASKTAKNSNSEKIGPKKKLSQGDLEDMYELEDKQEKAASQVADEMRRQNKFGALFGEKPNYSEDEINSNKKSSIDRLKKRMTKSE